jgi:hypothetical protein
VTATASQNTQVTTVASDCSRLRGLEGVRADADIEEPRLSTIVIIDNRN